MRKSRAVLTVAAAVAFGVAVAWFKDPGGDGASTWFVVRSAAGNVSSPWLLMPAIAGAGCASRRAAAIAGLTSTLFALAGFYLLTSSLIDLGTHSFVGSLRTEALANVGYFEAGLASGPLAGAAGFVWRRRGLPVLPAVGALLMAEPAALIAIAAVHSGGALTGSGIPRVLSVLTGWGLSWGDPLPQLAVYGAEFAAGVTIIAIRFRRGRAVSTDPRT